MKHQWLLPLVTTMLVIFAYSLVNADVEYIGKDTDTKGDWIGNYGENGAILFAVEDIVDLKDIKNYDTADQRWDWANPTGDERGLQYPDDANNRAGSCLFNNPVGLITIETKLSDYQVAVYVVDWDSSVRVEDLVGFQGGNAPNDPDVTVENPEFHEGIYYLWHVTGNEPFSLQITHQGGANWVVSGLFVDDLKGAAVQPCDKITVTWGQLKEL